MKMNKKGASSAKGVFIVLGVIVGLIAIWFIASYLFDKFGNLGPSISPIDKDLPNWLKPALGLFALENTAGLLQFIIVLVVFLILLFAMQDIISAFSTFSVTTSWIVAAGLGVLASLTGMITRVAGIFQLTAAVGAVGIGIIILTAVASAVIVNLFFGDYLRAQALKKGINEIKDKAKKAGGKINALVEMSNEAVPTE